MAIQLKDLTQGELSKAWLNKIIKGDTDAVPAERGEKDGEYRRRKEGEPYLPKRRPRRGAV